MSTVSLEEAQAKLGELISELRPGEEIQITKRDRPIARLIAETTPSLQPRQPGSAVGKLVVVSEDDEHLKDFQEYLP